MNRKSPHDALERAWQQQERALRSASDEDASPVDPLEVEAYRRLSHALRQPPMERLPSNFAWQVAQLASRLPHAAHLDLRLERWLMRGLVTVFVLGAVVAAFVYGGHWLRALDAVGSNAAAWTLLLAVCVGGSWLVDAARRWRKVWVRA